MSKSEVYILFSTQNCPHCIRPKNLAVELFKKQPGIITLCDAVEHPQAAKHYNIMTVPTLICQGDIVETWNTPAKVEAKLMELLK